MFESYESVRDPCQMVIVGLLIANGPATALDALASKRTQSAFVVIPPVTDTVGLEPAMTGSVSLPFITRNGPFTPSGHLLPDGHVLEKVGVDVIDAPSSNIHVCSEPVNEYAIVPLVELIEPLKVAGLIDKPGSPGIVHALEL